VTPVDLVPALAGGDRAVPTAIEGSAKARRGTDSICISGATDVTREKLKTDGSWRAIALTAIIQELRQSRKATQSRC